MNIRKLYCRSHEVATVRARLTAAGIRFAIQLDNDDATIIVMAAEFAATEKLCQF